MAKALSMVAVLLAVVALAIGFVIPGPTGPAGADGADGADGANGANGATGATGAAGAQGPAGAAGISCWDLDQDGTADPAEDINGDTVVDVRDCAGPPGAGTLMGFNYSDTDVGMVGCTNFMSVTITVPSAGTVYVSALLKMTLNHVTGTQSGWGVFVDESASGCDWSRAYIEEVGPSEPTNGIMEMSGNVQFAFAVASAGTYTYYLNGYMWFGQDAGDTMDHGFVLAVFFPG